MPVLACGVPNVLTVPDLCSAILKIHAVIVPIRDALNAADRVLGDGDTGMTIEQVAIAWHAVAEDPPKDLSAMLTALGKATMQASGASLAAVMSMGLLAAGRAVRDDGEKHAGHMYLAQLITVAVDKISSRSGATPGAKSVLDSLLAIRGALQEAQDTERSERDIAVDAARAALDAFRPRASQLGRARIYGDKSIGHDHPGMLAAYLLLQAAR
jgi:dihydroxyacetone kinase-like protein